MDANGVNLVTIGIILASNGFNSTGKRIKEFVVCSKHVWRVRKLRRVSSSLTRGVPQVYSRFEGVSMPENTRICCFVIFLIENIQKIENVWRTFFFGIFTVSHRRFGIKPASRGAEHIENVALVSKPGSPLWV